MDVAAFSTGMANINVAQQVSISAIKRSLEHVELIGEMLVDMIENSAGPVNVSSLSAGSIDISI